MNTNYPLFLPNVVKTFTDFENVFNDENNRLEETKKAFYVILSKNYFDKIVIVDGSNFTIFSVSEIIEIQNTYNVKIEQLAFQQDKSLVDRYGKGNGEMQITNFMVENSRLVKEAGGFVKLTPRYFFDNIDEVLPKIKKFENVFFFYYPPIIRKIKPFVMTILYKTSLEFYNRQIRESLSEHNKSISGYAESVFYRQIIKLSKNGIKVDFPKFSGTSGTTGKKIKNQYMFFRKRFSSIGMLCYRF